MLYTTAFLIYLLKFNAFNLLNNLSNNFLLILVFSKRQWPGDRVFVSLAQGGGFKSLAGSDQGH